MPFKKALFDKKETRILIITVIDSEEIKTKKENENSSTSLEQSIYPIKRSDSNKTEETENHRRKTRNWNPLDFLKTKTFLSRMVNYPNSTNHREEEKTEEPKLNY
jgi:hypothetical protein